jgi:ectoine hydroxylase-related dioxygenase (phytanoyl-CoA dioxygenase family)
MASMTNHVPLALPAGVIFLIDQAVWHCALPNTSGNARRNVIMGLSGEGRAIEGGALQAAVEENIAEGLFNAAQRECFGL